ncbi:MAG: hypothetical protein ACUVQG_06710 [Thermogutta sp.]
MSQQRTNKPRIVIPPHLPHPWPDQQAYDDLYREVNPYQDYSENDGPWQEIRIPPGSSAEQVYRRLPSALDFEYGGYLTKTRIRFVAGGPGSVWVPGSKPCTFHSHMTKIHFGEPDLPSLADIRCFLMSRSWRTITVGRFKLWVWEKTPATLDVVRRFWQWECNHMVATQRQLREKGVENWQREYIRIALRQIGVDPPDDARKWDRTWPRMLENKLGFVVEVFDR